MMWVVLFAPALCFSWFPSIFLLGCKTLEPCKVCISRGVRHCLQALLAHGSRSWSVRTTSNLQHTWTSGNSGSEELSGRLECVGDPDLAGSMTAAEAAQHSLSHELDRHEAAGTGARRTSRSSHCITKHYQPNVAAVFG